MANSFEELWSLVNAMEPQVPSYRLYYDQQGAVLFYSMEDCPGQWIEITAEQFAQADNHVRVVNGQLVPMLRTMSRKLVPGDGGTGCAVDNVAVVCAQGEFGKSWYLKTYETD